MRLRGVGYHLPATLTGGDGDPEKSGASGGSGAHACGKELKDELMAPLCFCGSHLEAITDVIQREFCKTQLEPAEAHGEGDCQREERGEPGAPVAGLWFPHHEEIVWP